MAQHKQKSRTLITCVVVIGILLTLCSTANLGFAGSPAGSAFTVYATGGYASVAAKPGGDYFVAWRSVTGGILGRIVHADGSLELTHLITTESSYPRVVYNSGTDRFAVLWAQLDGPAFYIYGQEINSTTGEFAGPAFVSNPINTVTSTTILYDAIYCPYTGWYAVVAAVTGDITPRFPVIQIMDAGGAISTINVDVGYNNLGKVAIAWDDINRNIGLAYVVNSGADWDVQFRTFNAYGAALTEPVDLAASVYDEDEVGLAFNSVAGQYMAAWVRHDTDNSIDNVVARRIATNGALLSNPSNILLTETAGNRLESVEVDYATGVNEATILWFQRDSYDLSSNEGRLLNASLDGSGKLTSAPLIVATSVNDNPGYAPELPGALAYCDGHNKYLLVYSGAGEAMGRFLLSIAPTPTSTPANTATPTQTGTATTTATPTNTATSTPFPIDGYEPDNTQETAKVILTGTQNTQQRTLYDPPGLDQDWIKFLAKPNRYYRVYTSDLGGTVDTEICVTVGINAPVCNDDRTTADHSSLVEFLQNEVTDVHAYIHVTNKGGDGSGARYMLTVEELSPNATPTPTATYVPGDSYEPDALIPAYIQLGVPQARSFYPDGDKDQVTISVKAGVRYIIQTYDLAPGVDTTLDVDDGAAYSDDRVLGNLSSYVEYTPTSDQEIVIVVNNLGQYGTGKTYTLSIETSIPTPTLMPTATRTPVPPPAVDSYEVDEGNPSTIIPNGGAQYHTFSPRGDSDYVTFAAKAGHTYHVFTQGLNEVAGVDTKLTVSGSDWSETNDDASAPAYWSMVTFESPYNEDVMVVIENNAPPSSQGWGETAYYQVKVVDTYQQAATPTLSLTPQDGTATAQPPGPTATPTSPCVDVSLESDASSPALIGIGATMNRAFCSNNDKDYVTFLAKAGEKYTVSTKQLAALVDTAMNTMVDGTVYENDDCGSSSASCLSFTPHAEQWVTVEIAQVYGHYGNDATYSVTVSRTSGGGSTDEVCDAYEPDSSNYASYVFGSPQSRCFSQTGDQDYATVLAKAGKRYAAKTTAVTGGADTYIRVLDGGSVLCEDDDNGGGLASLCYFSVSRDINVLIEVSNRGIFGANAQYTLEVSDYSSIGGSSTATPTPIIWRTPTPYPTPVAYPMPTSSLSSTSTPIATDRASSKVAASSSSSPSTPTPIMQATSVASPTATPTKVNGGGGGGSSGKPAGSVSSSVALSSTLVVSVFVDTNKDKIMTSDEGVDGLVVIALLDNAPKWQETKITKGGVARFVLPPATLANQEVLVQIPYLHRTGRFELPEPDEGGRVEANIMLPMPQYPVYLP